MSLLRKSCSTGQPRWSRKGGGGGFPDGHMAMRPPEAPMMRPQPRMRLLMSRPTGPPTRTSLLTKRRTRNLSHPSDPSHQQKLPLLPLHTQPLPLTLPRHHPNLLTHPLLENQTILRNQRTHTKHQSLATLHRQSQAILPHQRQATLLHQSRATRHRQNLVILLHQNLATLHRQSQVILRHQNQATLRLLKLATLHQNPATPPPSPPTLLMTAPLASIPITTPCRRQSPRPGRRGRDTPRRAATQSCYQTGGP